MTSKRKKSVQALIIIADIENSSHYAETSSPGSYNNMIREYHRIASKAVDEYCRVSKAREDAILHRKAYGDEILIILHSRKLDEIAAYALDLGVLLEVEWARSRFNSRRIREDKSPCRLRVGIGYGKITMAESVWGQGVTPEGYAIARTKRIESNAGAEINEPHILISSRIKSAVEKIKGIEIGRTEIIHPYKTVGTKSFEAIRIKSYEGLYNEFKKRIKTKDRYARWLTLGYQAFSAGDFNEALRCYKYAAKARPEAIFAMSNLAGILTKMGKLDEAEATLRKLLRTRKGCPEALNNLGTVLVRQGRIEEAETAYRRALRVKPEYPLALYNLGNTLNELNKYEEAEIAYRQAIKLKPEYAQALCNLASVKHEQGHINEALELARRALEIKPNHKVIIRIVTEFEELKMAAEFETQGKLKDAEKIYRKMTHSSAEYPLAYFNLGNNLAKQNRVEEAEAAYKNAIDLNPNYVTALCNYALMLKDHNRYEDALILAKRAMSVNSKREEVVELVGEFEELGKML